MEKNELAVFDAFKADLAAFKEHNAELSFDFAIPEEEEACRAHHRKLRKLWNGVGKLQLKTTEPLREKVTATNAEAKAIQAEVDTMAKPFKKQMDEADAAEAKKIADLAEKNRLAAEKVETDRLAEIARKEKEVDDKLAAIQEKEDELKSAADQIEADKVAETNRLEAIEKGKRQAAQDAEKAVAAAVAATELKAKQAADKIVADALEAKTKQDEDDEKERLRVANVEHRRTVEYEIYKAIETCVGDMDYTQSVLDGIKNGSIPHLEIKY